MSINSVLNNNISVQTNILNSRGETDHDVALKEYDGGAAAAAITITLDAEDSNSAGLITRGFGIKLPASSGGAPAGPQTITLQFVDEHKATAATNLIETHLGTQAAAGTGVVGYINANLLGATGVNSAREIRLTRHSPNGQTLAAAYLEVRILDRSTAA